MNPEPPPARSIAELQDSIPRDSAESRPPGDSTHRPGSPVVAPLKPGWTALLAALAMAAFHAGFLHPALWWLVLVWLGCLFALRRSLSGRWAFYTGLAIGLGIYGPQQYFFWTIFGPAAIALWLVLAFWLALFLLLLHGVERFWDTTAAVALAPVLWLGLEFFRSELYYLRFSWFTAGCFLTPANWSGTFAKLGVYGIGAVLMLVSGFISAAVEGGAHRDWRPARTLLGVTGVVFLVWLVAPFLRPAKVGGGVLLRARLAGVQLESPKVTEVIAHLDRVIQEHPRTDLVLLGEYTFDGPPPEEVRDWCRRNERWVVAGGKQPGENGGFYNMAFVVSPEGQIEFTQGKSVPIQFFNDGLPARRQEVWRWVRSESPDGRFERALNHMEPEWRQRAGYPIRVGLAICYDLSFAGVMDRLITRQMPDLLLDNRLMRREVPDLLLVPAMDAQDWGRHQHRLNARMTPIRAAEYRCWIFRVATSGFSQLVNPYGQLIAEAGVPGQGEIIAGTVSIRSYGRNTPVPLDRQFAPVAVLATAVIIVCLTLEQRRARRQLTSDFSLPTSSF